jgi:hypothetical protein
MFKPLNIRRVRRERRVTDAGDAAVAGRVG